MTASLDSALQIPLIIGYIGNRLLKTLPMSYDYLSLLPPVLAIILAIRTKQVFVSLLLGIWSGWMIIMGGNPITGTMATVQGLVAVFEDNGNTRTILFGALVGVLIVFIQRSGGVRGFIQWLEARLAQLNPNGNNRMLVQAFAYITGLLIFVESSISSLTVGTLYRPIFDELKISREKLAYLADSSSAPSSILIPFNGWGAFIMSLLAAQGFDNVFPTLLASSMYNFYPMIVIVMAFILIFTNKDFGPMKQAEHRALTLGKVLADDAKPMISEELTGIEVVPQNIYKARNMIIPILTMVLMMPIMLAYTGWESAITNSNSPSGLSFLVDAMSQGSGSTSVLMAVITAIVVSILLYKSQNIMSFGEMIDLGIKGISGMMPLAMLMLFAFAIGNICKALGTGDYVASLAVAWVHPGIVPAIIFVISCFIAFATGTSWGTFAIMIAIAVPMARGMDVNVHLAIAASLGGGVFGDHCSPISDTTIVSSMASASDHIAHVKTQMPYAMVAGGITILLYLVLGFMQ